MGHVNLPATRRLPRQWRLLDLVTASFFTAVVIFFILVFTSVGDSLAASGCRALTLSSSSDPRQRERICDALRFSIIMKSQQGVLARGTTRPLVHGKKEVLGSSLVRGDSSRSFSSSTLEDIAVRRNRPEYSGRSRVGTHLRLGSTSLI